MNQFTYDILLEFLYKFGLTVVFCLVGSFSKELIRDRKGENFNYKEAIISGIFASFLICAISEYITSMNLHFSVYVFASVVSGMYGLRIMKLIISKNFIKNFCGSIFKSVTDPIIKGAVESVSKTIEDEDTENNEETKEDK